MENFGVVGGTHISNKETILKEIDDVLQAKKSPDIEYILVMPYSLIKIPFTEIGLSYNAYGHAVIRYKNPDTDEDVIMNISGTHDLVTFYDPKEYLFSPDIEQGGVYNRAMIGIRYENVPKERIKAMHDYYCSIQKKSKTYENKFNIIFGPLFNLVRKLIFFFDIAERGNCAYWTSAGLKESGLLKHKIMWPKAIFVSLLENAQDKGVIDSNVHIVSYRRIKHAKLRYGISADAVSATIPFHTLSNYWYLNLEDFAHAKVEVEKESVKAEVSLFEHKEKPTMAQRISRYWFVPVGIAVLYGSVRLRRTIHIRKRKSTFKS